ncbi:MAG TPA: hypothetical protein VMT46_06045, partial [Anaerolineaceae bacterium]|nr:hypothetical protein [Anaerolineaceae bacterium]
MEKVLIRSNKWGLTLKTPPLYMGVVFIKANIYFGPWRAVGTFSSSLNIPKSYPQVAEENLCNQFPQIYPPP